LSFFPEWRTGRYSGGNPRYLAAKTVRRNAREYVANVSHELKTPITSIRSYAETLAGSGPEIPEETRRSFLDVIVNESDRMNKIVQDLLALSKFDAGEIRMRFEPFDIIQSIKNICNALILDVIKNGLNMSLDLEAVPSVEGDRDRIEQVIMNIISNAARYTPEGGEIAISAACKKEQVWICVKDTGIGITKEDIQRLFDRFYRVDKARSEFGNRSCHSIAMRSSQSTEARLRSKRFE
jgi:two-component system sensor histidine kinase VicK